MAPRVIWSSVGLWSAPHPKSEGDFSKTAFSENRVCGKQTHTAGRGPAFGVVAVESTEPTSAFQGLRVTPAFIVLLAVRPYRATISPECTVKLTSRSAKTLPKVLPGCELRYPCFVVLSVNADYAAISV